MAEFVDDLMDSIDDNGNLAGESLVESATSESSEGGQQVSSAPDEVGSNKSIETSAPVAEKDGERNGSGVDNKDGDASGDEGYVEKNPSPDGSASETEPKDTSKKGRWNDNYDDFDKKKASEMSPLEKAERKAERWKRRAKDMRRAKESLEAEFNKYKDLNPRAFGNDEDRMEFLAWKASTAQRLNDMDSDLESMDEEHDREQFQAKVACCYDEEGAYQFEKLDNHYRDAFAVMCGNIDPDNVILDFLSGSRYEAPMREVIYRNGKLQEELFRQFKNPMIASAERLNTLKALERQVKDFYERNRNPQPTMQRPQANSVQPQVINNQNQQVSVRQRFVLPSMRNRVAGATANVNNVNRTQVSAPQPTNNVPRQNVTRNPFAGKKATGSLTRGSEPQQQMDLSSQADALFKELMRSGM